MFIAVVNKDIIEGKFFDYLAATFFVGVVHVSGYGGLRPDEYGFDA